MSLRAPLSPRERDALAAIRTGAFSYGRIARALDPPVSPRRAEALVRSIASKLEGPPGPPLARVCYFAAWTAPRPSVQV